MINLFTMFIVISASASASKIDQSIVVLSKSPIQPKALFTAFATNEIVTVVKCVIDAVDGIANEYRCQSEWLDLQCK